MKRFLLMFAALPFLVVGALAMIEGIPALTAAAMLWPGAKAPEEMIPWAHPGGDYIVAAVDAWTRQRAESKRMRES